MRLYQGIKGYKMEEITPACAQRKSLSDDPAVVGGATGLFTAARLSLACGAA